MKTTPHTIHGIQGTYLLHRSKRGIQFWVSEPRPVPSMWEDDAALCRVTIDYDDRHGNGHNTFSITATVWDKRRGEPSRSHDRGHLMSGLCHDRIAETFPELAYLLDWHGMTSDGPLHYIQNTVYFAGDKDHYGMSAGEPYNFHRTIRFTNFPYPSLLRTLPESFLTHLEELFHDKGTSGTHTIVPVAHKHAGVEGQYQFRPRYTIAGYDVPWHDCPFDTFQQAQDLINALSRHHWEMISVPGNYSEGKVRQLDDARRSAIWPDATDEELSVPEEELKAKLQKRLPSLLKRFKVILDNIGFSSDPKDLQHDS